MYAAMQPHLTTVIKETDIVSFPWEEKLIETLTEEEEVLLLEQQKASEAFFLRWDERKAGKA